MTTEENIKQPSAELEALLKAEGFSVEQLIKPPRKCKYNTEEEKIAARREQQKSYRERKKKEIETLKNLVAELESKLKADKE